MKKQWYLLRGVEYSTDFNFFLENQIFTSKSSDSPGNIKLLSRLEYFLFGLLNEKFENDKNEITSKCKEIHDKLMSGGFGDGVLVEESDNKHYVRCNNCMWIGDEEELVLVEFDSNDDNETPTATEGSDGIVYREEDVPKDVDFLKGCPNCKTDHYLEDV